MLERKQEKIEIVVDDAYTDRFTIRRAGIGGKYEYFEVGIPKEVLEREARRHKIDIEAFRKEFELEALYNSFEGIHYRFVSKEPKPKLKE